MTSKEKTAEYVRINGFASGDLWRVRTADLLVVTQMLSQLS